MSMKKWAPTLRKYCLLRCDVIQYEDGGRRCLRNTGYISSMHSSRQNLSYNVDVEEQGAEDSISTQEREKLLQDLYCSKLGRECGTYNGEVYIKS